MSLLPRLLSMVRTIVTRFIAGLRWLARQTYRQRSLGVAGSPQLTRLLDLHAITVAAHMAVLAALVLAPPFRSVYWISAAALGVALTALGVWRSGRLIVGLLIAVQGIGAILAVRWSWGIAFLVGLALAQQATLLAVWIRHGASLPVLGRATAYGLLLGIFTGGGGLVVGVFLRDIPLWTAAILFTIAALLAIRLPDAGPRPPRVPRQAPPAGVPEGYVVYRPSSLEDKA